MSMDYLQNFSSLTINGKVTQFDFPIKNTLNINNVIIVILDIPNAVEYYENVFGVDSRGNIIWQIESAKAKKEYGQATPYIHLLRVDDNKFKVIDFYGIGYIVDSHTGTILEKFLTK